MFPYGCGEEMLIYGAVFIYCRVFYWMSAASPLPPDICDLVAISAAQIKTRWVVRGPLKAPVTTQSWRREVNLRRNLRFHRLQEMEDGLRRFLCRWRRSTADPPPS